MDLLRQSAVLPMAMEQHPVPQNITTFQFRLIGDMTIKQFAYLAGGAIAAYISYKLPLPFFITWPLAIFSGLLGFGLAFVPVEERPMDVWVLSFLRGVYSPTQFLWQQPKILETKQALPKAPPITVQSHVPVTAHLPVEIKSTTKKSSSSFFVILEKTIASIQRIFSYHEAQQRPTGHLPLSSQATVLSSHRSIHSGSSFLSTLFAHHDKQVQPAHQPVKKPIYSQANETTTPLATAEPLQQTTAPFRVEPQTTPIPAVPLVSRSREELLQDKIHSLEKAEHSSANTEINNLKHQLDSFQREKEMMTRELEELKKLKLASINTVLTPKIQPTSATTHVATPTSSQNAGVPRLTTFPNVVNGIIKNAEGTLLPGLLVTVRDKEGVPMRALKSNKLGQFSASTPLPDGTYIVEIEDPRNMYTFEKAQITTTGILLPALEIVAKSQKELTREKLTKELFGSPNT